MYRVKSQGRDGYEVFDDHLRNLVLRRLDTQSIIRRAVSGHGLVLKYQAILSLPDRVVVAAEALVRIRSGTDPLLLPEAFLDVAIETGLVRQIDTWVLRNAALQAQGWRQHRNGSTCSQIAVHINLTARDLTDRAFAQEVSTLLDEFGAGSCSLTTLRGMPLDLVKVHRAGVSQLETSTRDRALLGAVIGRCHDLDIPVLAAGVETAGQMEILTELGCDQVQGFLLARDSDADSVLRTVTNRSLPANHSRGT